MSVQPGPTQQRAEAARRGRGITILIVEDSPVQSELLRGALESDGYKVVAAGNGADAIDLARVNRPAAVVSDVNMPVMNGYAMCQAMRTDAELKHTPVILFTVLSDPRDVIRGLNAGADCYVTKPYNAQFLLSRLSDLISTPPRRDEPLLELEAKIDRVPFQVRAGGRQILDLLVSTYENAVLQNRELEAARDALASFNLRLEEIVQERTLELKRANEELSRDVEERSRLEKQVQQANERLSASVGRLQQRNAHLALLDLMGNRLQACRSLDEAYRIVAESASQLLPPAPGLLALVDSQRQRFGVAVSWGDIRIGTREWSSDGCQALHRASTLVASGNARRNVCNRNCAGLGKAGFCTPLIAQGEPLGVLHLQAEIPELAVDNAEHPSEQESGLRLVDAAAATIALAIANLRLQDDLRQQSLRDPLTGLYNRRYLEDALARESARARRSGTSLGVLMLDIDNFKQVNDNHGHLAGDLVLKWLGRFLRDGVRGEDVACRYGGEEFILLVPGATLENAATRAEQIRAGVESGSSADLDGLMIRPITVSLGVATLCTDVAGQGCIEDTVQAADDALRRAKQLGRNRIALTNAQTANAVPTAGAADADQS